MEFEENLASNSEPEKCRARLIASISTVLCLTCEEFAFYGYGENREEIFQNLFDSLVNDEFDGLENDSYLSKCTSSQFRKDVLQVVSMKVKNHIREEIGDSKFCIVVDGVCDQPGKEQMALILRFVDKKGFIQERLFDIVHVEENKFESLALKEEVCAILSRHNLDVSNIRGQGKPHDELLAAQLDKIAHLLEIEEL
ncbi:52 kDa repressor of the inhibitor of the protein kinase-like, partial [Trifolium medium]|nr:52 kDa repressor of the inhibitor of the protein kinase-like [Trifolium medium]